jgi:hypothetical protein
MELLSFLAVRLDCQLFYNCPHAALEERAQHDACDIFLIVESHADCLDLRLFLNALRNSAAAARFFVFLGKDGLMRKYAHIQDPQGWREVMWLGDQLHFKELLDGGIVSRVFPVK